MKKLIPLPFLQVCAVLGCYMGFKLTRGFLPPGLFRDSLPSLLFPLAFLPGLECFQRKIGTGSSPQRTACCALVSGIVLECIAPTLGHGTADPADFLALLLGTTLHILIQNHFQPKPPRAQISVR